MVRTCPSLSNEKEREEKRKVLKVVTLDQKSLDGVNFLINFFQPVKVFLNFNRFHTLMRFDFINPLPGTTPQQTNGSDCGMFTILCADHLKTFDKDGMTFGQGDMLAQRKLLRDDILTFS